MKELALNMKNQGFEDSIIAKCLNINIDELKKINELDKLMNNMN